MKTIRLLLAAVLAASALILMGCASHSIEQASTSLKFSNGMGKSFEVTLPKNLDATKLAVTVNPETKEFSLKADQIKSDASTVIESAATAQAEAIGKLADTLKSVVPLVLPTRQ